MKTNGTCAAVAVTALIASMQPSVAQISLDMNQITCREFLTYTPENQELVRFWLSGYYSAAANSKSKMTAPAARRARSKTGSSGRPSNT